jgi:hypothetical protein
VADVCRKPGVNATKSILENLSNASWVVHSNMLWVPNKSIFVFETCSILHGILMHLYCF